MTDYIAERGPVTKCRWCKNEMFADAVKCPTCNIWRMDIAKEIAISMAAFWVAVGIVIFGYFNRWWGVLFDWFMLDVFLESQSGLIVLLLFVASVYFYVKASRKIGSFWWM